MKSITVPPEAELPVKIDITGDKVVLRTFVGSIVVSNGLEAFILDEGKELDLREFGVIPEKICVKNPNDFDVVIGLTAE